MHLSINSFVKANQIFNWQNNHPSLYTQVQNVKASVFVVVVYFIYFFIFTLDFTLVVFYFIHFFIFTIDFTQTEAKTHQVFNIKDQANLKKIFL